MGVAGLHIEVEFCLGGLENGLRKQGNIQDWILLRESGQCYDCQCFISGTESLILSVLRGNYKTILLRDPLFCTLAKNKFKNLLFQVKN